MSANKNRNQVSLAGAAGKKSKGFSLKNINWKKMKKWPWKKISVLAGILAVILLGVSIFRFFYDPEGASLTAREMVEYDVTPDDISGKVSYYALGVTGKTSTSTLDMAAVLCFDRKANAISVIQVPVATYIDKDEGFAVNTLGRVWGHAKKVTFCASCRIRVPADQIDGDKHKTCGAKLENRTGSVTGDFVRVFNDQYGLPIDNYLLIPREGLVQLVESMGGLDIKLSKKTTLAGKTYNSGVQNLSAKAAVSYAIDYNYTGTPASDRARMMRQRQFWAALLQRFGASDMKDLFAVENGSTTGAFGSLMLSSNPIRFNTNSFGRARLMGVSESTADRKKLSEAVARFAHDLGKVKMEKVTFSILPGESASLGDSTVYSVNKAQTIELLNAQMNPYGLKLDDTTIKVPELVVNPSKADLATATLDKVAVEQKMPEEKKE